MGCKRLLLCAPLGLLAACARYRAQPIAPAEVAATLEARTLDAPGLARFAKENLHPPVWPPPVWDLSSLSQAALYFHPDLDLARAKWGVARAGVITAGQLPNPTLTLTGTYDALPQLLHLPWALGFLLELPLETFYGRGYRVDRARGLSEGARLEIASVAWQVHSRVRSSLLELWGIQSRLGSLRRQRELHGELASLLERRVAAGEASSLDLMRERIAADRAGLAVRAADRLGAEAHARLAAALGVPERALDGRAIGFDAFERPVPALAPPEVGGLRQAALLARADVQSSLAGCAAADAALQLELARQYPGVTLGGGFLWDEGERKFTFQPTVVLPVFNRNEGPIAEAYARRRESAARLLALQARIIADLERALAAFRAAGGEAATADSLLEVERRREEQVATAVGAGEAERMATLGAQLEVVSAELSRLDAHLAQRRALAAVEDAVERPLLGPVAPVQVPEVNPRPRQSK